jgi:hypothetical protein
VAPTQTVTPLSAFEAINFSLDEGRRELARLPTANGGFGLRSIADHCGIAFVAATVAAHELFPALLSQQTRDQLARSADTWLVLDDPVLLRFPPVAEFVTRYVDDGVAVRHAQRMLSRRLDRATSDALSPSLPEALQTRIVSAASPHANAWLAPAPAQMHQDGFHLPTGTSSFVEGSFFQSPPRRLDVKLWYRHGRRLR